MMYVVVVAIIVESIVNMIYLFPKMKFDLELFPKQTMMLQKSISTTFLHSFPRSPCMF